MATHSFDIAIYGSCGGGMTAAIRAARRGHNVVLLEWKPYIGGLVTGGLGTPDYVVGTEWGITTEFFEAIETAALADGGDPDIYGHRANGLIQHYTPEWARTARDTLFAGVSPGSITTVADIELAAVTKDTTTKRITSVTLTNGDIYQAGQWADGSYEGDLLRLAGVALSYGRDSALAFGEPMAGVNLDGALTRPWGVVRSSDGNLWRGFQMPNRFQQGQADLGVQAFDWRMTFSNGDDRVAFAAPAGYREADFADWLDQCNALAYHTIGNFLTQSQVTTSLYTTNGADMTGTPYLYPRILSKVERLKFWQQSYYWLAGRLYAAQTATSSPSAFKTSVAAWGLPADQNQSEYFGTPGWSAELYVRENNRMIGAQKIMTFSDVMTGVTEPDSIATGGYNSDSHTVQYLPTAGQTSILDGTFNDTGRSLHYPISFRALKPNPEVVSNLLGIWVIGDTHTVECSARMEPTKMVIGDSVGMALSLGTEMNLPAGSVPYGALKELLVDASAKI